MTDTTITPVKTERSRQAKKSAKSQPAASNVAALHGQSANFAADRNFVLDLCRYSEGLTSESAIRKKYRVFDDAVWTKLGDDDELVRAIEEEKINRVRSGQLKREKAQIHVVRAPDVLMSILENPEANARHRIDSARALDDFATGGSETATSGQLFQITINLGEGHVEHYSKPLTINHNTGDTNSTEAPRIEPLTARERAIQAMLERSSDE